MTIEGSLLPGAARQVFISFISHINARGSYNHNVRFVIERGATDPRPYHMRDVDIMICSQHLMFSSIRTEVSS